MRLKLILTNSQKQFLRKYENQLLTELHVAFLEARKNGKRSTMDEQLVEVDAELKLKQLARRMITKTYLPSRGEAHVITNPVRREIFAAPFIDRIVQHWVYDKIKGWWDKHFIYDAYSCREGKGTLVGIKRLDKMIRRASGNYAKEVWVVKLDIQGYFMSIRRETLFEAVMWGLDKQRVQEHMPKIEYETLKYVIRKIIFDDPVRGVKRRGWPRAWKDLPKNKSLFYQLPGIGIVIGNLTSQLFSNILLDRFDRYVKHTLNYTYYGRYVDDFFIVVDREELTRLQGDMEKIRRYLQNMGLTLHPKKIYIQKASKGVQFLGGVVYPGHVQPSERVKRNYRKAVKKFAEGKGSIESVISYRGHVTHLSCHDFERKIFSEVGWERF